jgi:hypothetical protein
MAKLVKKYTYKGKKSNRKQTRRNKKGGIGISSSLTPQLSDRNKVAKELDDCLGIIKNYNPNLSLPDSVKNNYKQMYNRCLLLRPNLEEKLIKLTSSDSYIRPFERIKKYEM